MALPDLGVAAVLAKLDTGAHGSAIHATDIILFGPADRPEVKFTLHPLPEQPELTVACVRPLADRRTVTSSNGRSELRPFIRTRIVVGPFSCEAELSLTARPTLRHRMLLGRVALSALGAVVDPSRKGLAVAEGPPALPLPPSLG